MLKFLAGSIGFELPHGLMHGPLRREALAGVCTQPVGSAAPASVDALINVRPRQAADPPTPCPCTLMESAQD